MSQKYIDERSFKHHFEYTPDGENWFSVYTYGTVVLSVVPPNFSTWDSDLDYYGYSEIVCVNEDGIYDNFGNEVIPQEVFPDFPILEYERSLNDYIEAEFGY